MTLSIIILFKFFAFFTPVKATVPATIYEFKVAGLEGGKIDLAKYKGKKILIVNTASKCGYTPQYAELQAASEKYKGKLVIVGFPSNDFGAQEPGTDQEISDFCQKNYGVTFPMAAKISVKGQEMAPIYHWLTEKKYNNFKDSEVRWNFQKYLIDEKGNLIGVYDSKVKITSPELTADIERK